MIPICPPLKLSTLNLALNISNFNQALTAFNVVNLYLLEQQGAWGDPVPRTGDTITGYSAYNRTASSTGLGIRGYLWLQAGQTPNLLQIAWNFQIDGYTASLNGDPQQTVCGGIDCYLTQVLQGNVLTLLIGIGIKVPPPRW